MMKKLILLTGFAALFAFTTEQSNQIIKTQLVLTVRNSLGNTVEGATVKLYKNEDDYNKEQNVVAEGITDKKGVAKFKDLEAIPYYLLVEKDDMNNFGGGEKIEALQESRINKSTVVIE